MIWKTEVAIQYRPRAPGMTKPIQRDISGIISSMVLLVLAVWGSWGLPAVLILLWR